MQPMEEKDQGNLLHQIQKPLYPADEVCIPFASIAIPAFALHQCIHDCFVCLC